MTYEKYMVGFKKTGEEVLVCMLDEYNYFDLIASEPIRANELDLATLNFFETQSIFKSKVIKTYKNSRKELLQTAKFILGSQCKAINIRRTSKSLVFPNEVECKWSRKFLKSELYTCDAYKNFPSLSYFLCKNLEGQYFWSCKEKLQDDYNLPPFQSGDNYVVFSNITLEDLTRKSILNRKQINEYDYEIKKKSLGMRYQK